MKIAKKLVQKGDKQDDCLTRKCFPVNIRLLRDEKGYWLMIHQILEYMTLALFEKYEDYGELKGISGANLGIPFNIVIIAEGEYPECMILLNPEIIGHSDETRVVKSNCGSLNLEKAIKVKRYKEISIQYNELNPSKLPAGSVIKVTRTFKGPIASTIQHEIDHNNGILINTHKRIAK